MRSDSTRKHAVCRYKKGVRKEGRRGPIDVSRIDIHPFVLSKRWENYARYLLFHEYIHALGFSNHGPSLGLLILVGLIPMIGISVRDSIFTY